MNARMNMGFPSPDFVICGVQHGAGVRLFASKELQTAELRAEADYWDVWGGGLYGPTGLDPVFRAVTSSRYILTAEMRKFIMIDAPDYAAAFKYLFETWSPEPARRPEISEGQRAIEGAGDE